MASQSTPRNLEYKIEHVFRQYRPRFSLSQRFETKSRSNFLNFIKIFRGENGVNYVMKVPKVFSDLICYIRIAVFNLLGDNAIIYAPFPDRMKNEKEKIKCLNEKGIPSLPLVDIELKGALVTKFIRGTNLKDILRYDTITFKEKLKLLGRSCERLQDIHTYFSHGDAQIRNILVVQDNEVVWLDYEYIVNPDIPVLKAKARDLIFFIFSSVKHLGCPDEVVEVILNAYKDDEVKKIIPLLSVYQSTGYNMFLNLLNPAMCLRVRNALRKQCL